MELAEKIKTEPVSSLMVKLSAPAIMSMLLNAVNTAIDGIFAGRGIGTAALSAVTVSMGIVLVIQAFSLLVAAGTSALVALKLGKGDGNGAERVVGNGVSLSMVLAAVLTGLGLVAVKPMLALYGASGDNLQLAVKYATVMIGGSVFLVLGQVANNALKGMGYGKQAFLNFGAGILVNVILNYCFIFIFQWGMFGAAFSTVIGNGVCAVLALRFLTSEKSMARLRGRRMGLEKETVTKLLSIGLPACIMQLALSMVSLAFNHAAGSWGGTDAVAAYGVMYAVIMVAYMPVMGLGQGIQPIIGFNYGGANYERVRAALGYGILWSTLFCTVMFLLVEISAPAIVRAFGGDQNPSLMEIAVPGLRMFCLMLPAVGFQMIGANYFQYVGKIRQSVILGMLRQLILLVPMIAFLPRLLGLSGIWLATPAADLIAFLVTLVFVRRELTVLVPER